MEITDVCLMPQLLLEKCKRNELLAPIFYRMNGDMMCQMFSRIVNTSSCSEGKGHVIGDIHNLYEVHKKHGIRGVQLLEFGECLRECYQDLYPERDISEHHALKDVMALIHKVVEHEKICTVAIINDILYLLDNEPLNKCEIKQKLERVLAIINHRFGC